uniref:Putative ovule protein n=1 Tax=Solanum chacoense TaxID=4108 RepID=A0A0V0GSB6_SOLCH
MNLFSNINGPLRKVPKFVPFTHFLLRLILIFLLFDIKTDKDTICPMGFTSSFTSQLRDSLPRYSLH